MKKIINRSSCLLWPGSRSPQGYGRYKNQYMHRVLYEAFVGPIPKGLELDHLCRNRACMNTLHLEPVTRKENARRGLNGIMKQTCAKGHDWKTYSRAVTKTNKKWCLLCHRERQRIYREKKTTE